VSNYGKRVRGQGCITKISAALISPPELSEKKIFVEGLMLVRHYMLS